MQNRLCERKRNMNFGGLLLGIFIAAFLYAFMRPRKPDKNAEEEKPGADLVATLDSTPAVEEPVDDPEEKPALKPALKSALKSDKKVKVSDDAADGDDVPIGDNFKALRGSKGLGEKPDTIAEGSDGIWGTMASFFTSLKGG